MDLVCLVGGKEGARHKKAPHKTHSSGVKNPPPPPLPSCPPATLSLSIGASVLDKESQSSSTITCVVCEKGRGAEGGVVRG